MHKEYALLSFCEDSSEQMEFFSKMRGEEKGQNFILEWVPAQFADEFKRLFCTATTMIRPSAPVNRWHFLNICNLYCKLANIGDALTLKSVLRNVLTASVC